MKRTVRVLLIMCLSVVPFISFSQQKLSPKESSILIKGTSTIHDWRCKVEQLTGDIQVEKAGATVKAIKVMDVQMVVKSIKSLKEDGSYYEASMDKNVYKALNADKNPQITFSLKKVNSIGANGEVNALATVKIAGVAKDLIVTGVAKQLPNGSVKITGKKAMKMTDFNVDPPKAMLGAIRTGDDITIEFDLLFK
ncbi:YceI family protein [Solitalea sp. MAHUQ-68]|uniref:YceI family protein n=1 Tax=Solitalea agri TaxID=2953739 RepID=A0A9X2FB15_9SPHI|nr:YceI family protein [Solitalea agri]MCO4293623.1 YceI family protein [Solitalea agri]